MSAQKINIPMLGIFLGGVAAVAAGLLAGVQTLTAPQIEANQLAAANEAMMQVLPEYDNDPTLEAQVFQSVEGWDVTYFTARKDGEIVGYAGKVVTPEGFPDGDGNISLMVGLEPDGAVGTVLVTASSETPGLGTAITNRKLQKTIVDLFSGGEVLEGLVPNKYLDWYAGKTAGEERWAIVKEGETVNGKTGATITSKAICGGVYAVSRTAIEHLEELNNNSAQ
ncbi:RnfABCDGE type electron transport complex subunit G [Pontiellaceae bacterium B12219]|nr:RnfABCDGE type electron transport complex subunit G [Pontiellaceae bacterium B12219]